MVRTKGQEGLWLKVAVWLLEDSVRYGVLGEALVVWFSVVILH